MRYDVSIAMCFAIKILGPCPNPVYISSDEHDASTQAGPTRSLGPLVTFAMNRAAE